MAGILGLGRKTNAYRLNCSYYYYVDGDWVVINFGNHLGNCFAKFEVSRAYASSANRSHPLPHLALLFFVHAPS